MMKIYFHGPSLSAFRPDVGVSCITGISTSKNVESVWGLRQSFNLTGNTGNMIHAEAPLKFLKYDVNKSVVGDLHKFYSSFSNKKEFFNCLEERFDCLVLSLANLIRPDFNTNLDEILSGLTIPFYVFGVGLQQGVVFSSLRPSTQRLLSVINSDSKLFGVRGNVTENWLHENGFNNAVALGCPSLYVYPKEIQSVRYKRPTLSKVMTAGHLSDYHLSSENNRRVSVISRILEGFDEVSYVHQDEPFTYSEILHAPGVWVESISQLDKSLLNSYLSLRVKRDFSFSEHYLFFSTDAWRLVCSYHDAFVGDRLHAGIASLQSGTPSLIIYDDMRVKELSDYNCFPAASVDEVLAGDIKEIVEEKLSEESLDKFLQAYKHNFEKFYKVVMASGLRPKDYYANYYECSSGILTEDNVIVPEFEAVDQSMTRSVRNLVKKTNNKEVYALYSEVIEKSVGREEAWNFLWKNVEELCVESDFMRLFVVEKSIDYNKSIDVDRLLLEVNYSAISRGDYRRLARILKSIENPERMDEEVVEKILNIDHADVFDAIIYVLPKVGKRLQAVERLKQKLLKGFGTRLRVKTLLTYLLEEGKIEDASEVLGTYSHYLSEKMASQYRSDIESRTH